MKPIEQVAPTPPHRGLLLALFATVLAALVVLGALAEDVWTHEGFPWDAAILEFLHRHASPSADTLMLLFTRIGDPIPMACFVAVIFGVLALRRQWHQAAFLVVAVGGAMILNATAKALFQRARPDLWEVLRPEMGFSFPSGHAMGSMAVAGALTVLAWPTRWRWPVMVLGGLFALLVGVSRLYLGVHFPSDVLAGWLASVAWVGGVQLIRQHRAVWQLYRPRRSRDSAPLERGSGSH